MATQSISAELGDKATSSQLPSKKPQEGLEERQLIDHLKGVIYGNCIGDAVGLLTEFMDKEEAQKHYGESKRLWGMFQQTTLEYHKKIFDRHRSNWETGDWTDDSDQMLLILKTFLDNDGQFNAKDFAAKLKYWARYGYPELGDNGGCGLGRSTYQVLSHPGFLHDPHAAAQDVWDLSGRYLAPNGGVMRTSIVGTMQFYDLEKVVANTKNACKVTHADPRCIASCIAVTIAIALMLQGKHMNIIGDYDVDKISKVAYENAVKVIEDDSHKEELKQHMFEENLENLKLDEKSSIGYTFKCLGAGFWAFRQSDFRDAITRITMEAGDADTNCAVAGALLGCKIGFNKLPDSWVTGLRHRRWLDSHINSYMKLFCLPSS